MRPEIGPLWIARNAKQPPRNESCISNVATAGRSTICAAQTRLLAIWFGGLAAAGLRAIWTTRFRATMSRLKADVPSNDRKVVVTWIDRLFREGRTSAQSANR